MGNGLFSVEKEIPISLIAGDSKTFTVTFLDFTSANGWQMYYVLNGAEDKVKIKGTANGNGWDFTIKSYCTKDWAEQYAAYAIFAEKADDRKTLARGSIQIFGNPDNVQYGARLQQLQEDLKSIRDFKSRLAKDPKLSMTFGGRQFSRANVDELLKLETNIAKELHTIKYGLDTVRKTIRANLGR